MCVCLVRETDKANAIVEFLLPFAAVRAETENPPYFREALKCQREIFHKRHTAQKSQPRSSSWIAELAYILYLTDTHFSGMH